MKKYKTIILMCIFTTLGMIIGRYTSKNDVYEQDTIKRKNNNTISMMLETDTNSKTYIQSTDSTWPTDGYVFNEEMSKCEQGSKLSWDDTNKKVVMEGNTSDKCYVFFDKYNPIKINNYSITSSGNKITIVIDATSGTGTIGKYYYSKDDGVTFIESNSNTYVFTNLEVGTYKIKAYVQDKNGKNSNIIFKNIEIVGQTLAEFIISKYNGTQGNNNIYYHDSSLANGANDNSYRYAGSSTTTNNYVCFGSDDATCPADNLYRIFGVFNNQVKLIKSTKATSSLLGTDGDYSTNTEYHWNYMNDTTLNSGNGSNEWSTSLLNAVNLNTNFLNKFTAEWQDKIAVTTWSTSGSNGFSITPKAMFDNEITNSSKKYRAKIGLMYASDYGFSAGPSAWNKTLWNYAGNDASGASIKSITWTYITSEADWTISPASQTSDEILCVYGTNNAIVSQNGKVAQAVRPVFYLNENVSYIKGSGTSADPYRVN